jgi:hypothetical protein
MSVTVRIPSPLRPITGGLGELKVEGGNCWRNPAEA